MDDSFACVDQTGGGMAVGHAFSLEDVCDVLLL
jgi:hypothetical protein